MIKRSNEQYDMLVEAVAKQIAIARTGEEDFGRFTEAAKKDYLRIAVDLVDAFDFTHLTFDEFAAAWRSVEERA